MGRLVCWQLSDSYLWGLVLLPITNLIVRWRLAYHPKQPIALVVDEAERAEAITVRKAPGIFATAKSIYKTDGVSGLYKGFLPLTCCLLVIYLITSDLCSSYIRPFPKYIITPGPTTINRSFSDALFTNFGYTIGLVWIYRSIATPAKLSLYQTSIKEAVAATLSPYELSHMLLPILATPGLPAAVFINIVWRVYLLRWFREIFFEMTWTSDTVEIIVADLCMIGLYVFTTFTICAPLDMVVTRLCVQRNARRISTWKDLGNVNKCLYVVVVLLNIATITIHFVPNSGLQIPKLDWLRLSHTVVAHIDAVFIFYASWMTCRGRDRALRSAGSASEPSAEPPALTNSQSSPVIPTEDSGMLRQRDDQEPYTGLFDCLRTIVKEEGWSGLYRGWWITALGLLVEV